ncbi:MAG: ferrochelatase [Bacteroidota bacterium]
MKDSATITDNKTGVLIINLGTPDSPSVPDVRRYLRQFLLDERVIDIPELNRQLLINLVIVPFRGPKSAKVYKELWDERGSPLKYYGEDLTALIKESLGENFMVELAMRYQNPSIESALEKMKKAGLKKIIVLPLFPQYASASTGSVQQEVMRLVSKWLIIPDISFISSFWDKPLFIQAFTEIGRRYMNERNYDHILFTYHGLPERQLTKADEHNVCSFGTCCNNLDAKNQYCYRAQCYATTRLLADSLGLKPEQYTVSFQSRLGKTPWIKPYTDEVIDELAKKGYKSVLAFSPSFVADCLETTVEIGREYRELFEAKGGKHWQLVESLNVNTTWVEAVESMIREQV